MLTALPTATPQASDSSYTLPITWLAQSAKRPASLVSRVVLAPHQIRTQTVARRQSHPHNHTYAHERIHTLPRTRAPGPAAPGKKGSDNEHDALGAEELDLPEQQQAPKRGKPSHTGASTISDEDVQAVLGQISTQGELIKKLMQDLATQKKLMEDQKQQVDTLQSSGGSHASVATGTIIPSIYNSRVVGMYNALPAAAKTAFTSGGFYPANELYHNTFLRALNTRNLAKERETTVHFDAETGSAKVGTKASKLLTAPHELVQALGLMAECYIIAAGATRTTESVDKFRTAWNHYIHGVILARTRGAFGLTGPLMTAMLCEFDAQMRASCVNIWDSYGSILDAATIQHVETATKHADYSDALPAATPAAVVATTVTGAGSPNKQKSTRNTFLDKNGNLSEACAPYNGHRGCSRASCPHKHVCLVCSGPHMLKDTPACLTIFTSVNKRPF